MGVLCVGVDNLCRRVFVSHLWTVPYFKPSPSPNVSPWPLSMPSSPPVQQPPPPRPLTYLCPLCSFGREQEELLAKVSRARKHNDFNTDSPWRHCNPPFGDDLSHEVRYGMLTVRQRHGNHPGMVRWWCDNCAMVAIRRDFFWTVRCDVVSVR